LQGKRPIPGTHGHKDATTDPKVIKAWWKEYPDANVGIACDSEAGPIVIDIDGRDGMLSLAELNLPTTLEASSGRKNRKHFYFESCDVPIRRSIKVKPGIDVLGDGGYVVAPPSIHPKTGRPYTWLNGNKIKPFPFSVLKIMKNRRNGAAPPLPDIIPEGQRDDLLTSLAGTMRRRGASEEAIIAALREENETRCRPPMPDAQILKIARSIAQKDPAPSLENLTDLGNARRFVMQHHKSVKFVRVWKRSWLIWDGVRWSPDETGEADRLAKATVREIYKEAQGIEDTQIREDLIKHAAKSESANKIRSMLELASTEPEVASVADAFDTDPWILNVENGTVDLRTGELRPHRRDDLLTKLAPVVFDRGARAPVWRRFLNDITNSNEELQAYLQRAIGYSLTADVREQCLFFCFGSGQNGKSTFLEVLREMFGDYGQQSEFSTFLSRTSEGPRNDLARMRGIRLVSAVEAPGDKSFDESVLKQLTGGDTITARRLYEEHFEFRPTHKLFLAANHKPHVNEQTEAFWRRIRLIPFTVYIPPEKRDRDIKTKLSRELSGILNWAIEGCLSWQRDGLGEPLIVQQATKSYREEEDLIGEFIVATCQITEKAWVSTSDLYQAFTSWWRETRGVHARPPQARWFGRALGERPELKAAKRHRVRGWRGIALKVELS
jgi:putative DNA primase/helicase